MLYTLSFKNMTCQLYLNKSRGKRGKKHLGGKGLYWKSYFPRNLFLSHWPEYRRLMLQKSRDSIKKKQGSVADNHLFPHSWELKEGRKFLAMVSWRKWNESLILKDGRSWISERRWKGCIQRPRQPHQKRNADLNDWPDIGRDWMKVETALGSNERRLNWWSEFKLWRSLTRRLGM